MNKVKTTPEQIARFGHIAIALRGYMDRSGKTPKEINIALGREVHNPGIYLWCKGKQAPPSHIVEQLSRLTGISEIDLTPKQLNGTGKSLIVIEKKQREVKSVRPVMTIGEDGQANIALNVTLPIDQASDLLKLIVEWGLFKK